MTKSAPKKGKIGCIGVGNIGRAWAIVFARAGYDVALFDAQPGAVDLGLATMSTSLGDLEESGLITSAAEVAARMHSVDTLAAALEGADYVQESVKEHVDVKTQVFAEMAAAAGPETLFGSSVSAIPGSKFMGGTEISPRCIVVHPTNPPYLVPLTELCLTPWTADSTYDRVHQLMLDVGQVPVRLNREIEGYALNRLQAAVVAEALHLVGEGYISPEDLDRTMSSGLGLRWAFMGPFMTGHLNASGGYRSYMTMYGDSYREASKSLRMDYPWDMDVIGEVDDAMTKTFPTTDVERGQAWRDRRLMALRQHLDEAAKRLD